MSKILMSLWERAQNATSNLDYYLLGSDIQEAYDEEQITDDEAESLYEFVSFNCKESKLNNAELFEKAAATDTRFMFVRDIENDTIAAKSAQELKRVLGGEMILLIQIINDRGLLDDFDSYTSNY